METDKVVDVGRRDSMVYLVGAGPGDLGLLTLRAVEILQTADAVVYDYLVDSAALKYCKSDAELHDVGKRPSKPVRQDDINRLLVELADRHRRVVRLKGGDPFVFGRGGEEILALETHGIAFEVVPGVSSVHAVPAYGGTPVTHRGLSQGYVVITGHAEAGQRLDLEWDALVRLNLTLVVLMGVAHRGEIASSLMACGMGPKTPVVAVTWGTTYRQRTVRVALEELGSAPIESPAVMVIGGSASFSKAWIERRPLFGLKVCLARDDGDGRLLRLLGEDGAEVVVLPTTSIAPPRDGYMAMEGAIERIQGAKWLVFSSKNAVKHFLDHVDDLRVLGNLRIAAVGKGTQAALATYRLGVDFIAPQAVAESFVEAFPSGEGRVIFPRAENARDVLAEGLRAKGWDVEDFDAYRSEALARRQDAAETLEGVHAMIFTSGSSVSSFIENYGTHALPNGVISIGPVTSSKLADYGVEVSAEADPHDFDGVRAAVQRWWEQARSSISITSSKLDP